MSRFRGVAWACLRVPVLASAILLSSATMAVAVPVLADVVSCTGGLLGTCTVEPTGGPVDVDPLGFTLEVTWGPDFILFTEDPFGGTQSGHMQLFFTFTGTHDGTEHLETSRSWTRTGTRFSTRPSASTT